MAVRVRDAGGSVRSSGGGGVRSGRIQDIFWKQGRRAPLRGETCRRQGGERSLATGMSPAPCTWLCWCGRGEDRRRGTGYGVGRGHCHELVWPFRLRWSAAIQTEQSGRGGARRESVQMAAEARGPGVRWIPEDSVSTRPVPRPGLGARDREMDAIPSPEEQGLSWPALDPASLTSLLCGLESVTSLLGASAPPPVGWG